MPVPNFDSAPRRPLVINGETFSIVAPYVAGHVITDGEARALNQVLSENVRNNLAKQHKDAKEKAQADGTPMQFSQQTVDDYTRSYDWYVRDSGPKLDPVEREARNSLEAKIKAHLSTKGQKVSKEEFAKLVDKNWANPAVRDPMLRAAEKAIAARRKAADALGDLDLSTEPAEATEA